MLVIKSRTNRQSYTFKPHEKCSHSFYLFICCCCRCLGYLLTIVSGNRYGTSVLGVGCVWCSAAYAARAYRAINPVAGILLAVPLLWLSIASSLIVRTWQLNPTNPVTGTKASFLPTKPADTAVPTITKLAWFE